MRAKDIMTTSVIAVSPTATVQEIAELLNKRRISAVFVLDQDEQLRGVVSEGDLLRLEEIGGVRHTDWWLTLLSSPTENVEQYVKLHGRKASDVMTTEIVSASEEATIAELAHLLEKNRIKRVPILRDGAIVGVVSRADLLHGIGALRTSLVETEDNVELREEVKSELLRAHIQSEYVNPVVVDGVVDLWGMVYHEKEVAAAEIAAKQVPGVKEVNNHLSVIPTVVQAWMY